MDKSKKFRYLYESFRESRGNICIYIYTYFSIPFDSYVNTFISLIPLIPFSLYINVGERVTHTDANHLSVNIKYNERVSSCRFIESFVWFSFVSLKVIQLKPWTKTFIPLIPFNLYINVGERVTHTDANHLSASIKYNEGVSSFRFWFSSVSWKVTQPSLNPESKDASEDFDKGTILVKKKKKRRKISIEKVLSASYSIPISSDRL